jgi:hypothetical protein
MVTGDAAMSDKLASVVAALMVPWNAFVAAFLYYALLAMIVLGGVSPDTAVVGTAYLAPIVAYAVVVLFRLGAAGAHGVAGKRPLAADGVRVPVPVRR